MTRRIADLVSRSRLQHAMAAGGIVGLVLWLIAFAASGFLPPIPPSWDAERTVEHYRAHAKGIQAGAALMLVGGAAYLCQVAAMAAQVRRIPDVPDAAHALQLGAGTLGAFCFMLPGIVLAAAAYRLDRPAETTQALNDLFMFSIVLPWPPFAAQALAFAWAVLADRRPTPLFPTALAMLNMAGPVLYVLAIAAHCVATGPLAWDGALGLWVPAAAFGVLVAADFICVLRATGETDAAEAGSSLEGGEATSSLDDGAGGGRGNKARGNTQ